MTKFMKAIAIILFISVSSVASGQSKNKETAYSKGKEAIKLMDNGEIEKSIKLLEEAKKLDPKNIDYPYEIAYAHYLKKDYKTAIKILEPIKNHADANDRVFQLLGNSYSMNGQREKAINAYEQGLKKFPNSGKLFLELGNVEMFVKEYGKALDFYEKGIYVDPKFPSNYFWAAKIYCGSSEEVWGMIYGEIFMNLERNSKRTAEISKLLFDTYQREIEFTDDSSFSVSFSKNNVININDLKDPNNFKIPFGVGVYEPTLMLSMLTVNSVNITTLNIIRSTFVDIYFTNGYDKTHPNALFSYQKQVKEAGHFEAYNHWILMKGDETAFAKWQNENKEKWDSFLKWFRENGLKITDENKFHSGQY